MSTSIKRPYSADDVRHLQGSVVPEHTFARRGAEKFRNLLETEPFVAALGALTGNQAVQQVRAGLRAIYVSGWQVAADANLAGQMYPDQSLYPSNSVPALVKRINQALQRADQISHAENRIDWFAPIVADAEAGFGGPLNVFELVKAMIEAGAAASNIDERDHPFVSGERTAEGFFRVRAGIDQAIARALSYAPYADMLWFETSKPDLDEAKSFAERVHAKFPGKLFAYNCSPSFNWKAKLDSAAIARFQRELGAMGYKFQFVTLAGFHTLNYSMFKLARGYRDRGMAAYSELQESEFEAESDGYSATRHQREVGTGYFDEVAKVIAGGETSTGALAGSTEREQFT